MDQKVPTQGILNRRAYSPVLRQPGLTADTTIPWWHNRCLRFQFS